MYKISRRSSYRLSFKFLCLSLVGVSRVGLYWGLCVEGVVDCWIRGSTRCQFNLLQTRRRRRVAYQLGDTDTHRHTHKEHMRLSWIWCHTHMQHGKICMKWMHPSPGDTCDMQQANERPQAKPERETVSQWEPKIHLYLVATELSLESLSHFNSVSYFSDRAAQPFSKARKPKRNQARNEMKCCSCKQPRLQPLHAKRQFKYKVSKCGRFSYQLFIQLDARLALQMKMRTERERRWERERDCRATPTLWVFVKWKLRCGACGCNLYLVILHAVPQKIFEICTLGWPQAKLKEEISA